MILLLRSLLLLLLLLLSEFASLVLLFLVTLLFHEYLVVAGAQGPPESCPADAQTSADAIYIERLPFLQLASLCSPVCATLIAIASFAHECKKATSHWIARSSRHPEEARAPASESLQSLQARARSFTSAIELFILSHSGTSSLSFPELCVCDRVVVQRSGTMKSSLEFL